MITAPHGSRRRSVRPRNHLADTMLMFVPLSREHKYAYEVWNKALSEEWG